MLSAGCVSHLTFAITLLGRDFDLHFTSEEAETQGG